jgi:hypothetical protein
LADAICAMANDRPGLMVKGAQARDAMLRSYTLEVFLDAYRSLYDEAGRRAGHR